MLLRAKQHLGVPVNHGVSRPEVFQSLGGNSSADGPGPLLRVWPLVRGQEACPGGRHARLALLAQASPGVGAGLPLLNSEVPMLA